MFYKASSMQNEDEEERKQKEKKKYNKIVTHTMVWAVNSIYLYVNQQC